MEFRNLSSAGLISLDVETKDPDLSELGPSTFRGGGYICGVSVATDDGFCEYFPVRHEGEGNLDREQVFAWLREQLAGPQPKLGANLLYDLEWLRKEGVPVAGPKWDVQTAQSLIDENRKSYRLDDIAWDLLSERKDERDLIGAGMLRGIHPENIKENLWKIPGPEVAPYGRQDALLPIKIWSKQKPVIEAEALDRVFKIESELIEVLLEMRFKGVRIDEGKAAAAAETLNKRKKVLEQGLYNSAGWSVDYWSNKDIETLCEHHFIDFPRTGKGNASFESDWLTEHPHPLMKQIAQIRLLDRTGGVFISRKIIGAAVNGRVHGQFYPVRGDKGGARSGRISMANPNMQQYPSRNEELARIVRSCFIPEEGEEWLSADWSQVEPRVTVHYAELLNLPGAKIAGDKYRSGPATDYHQMTADLASISRKAAKTINLGLAYGMGKGKLSASLGLSASEGEELYGKYHRALPFIKMLGQKCTRMAEARGWVKTILGRRRRYDLFGPFKWSEGITPLSYQDALQKYGRDIKRYFTYRAMNAVIQGSSADLMKLLLVNLYKKGLCPNLTIHDEVCKSIKSREEAKAIAKEMETVYPLNVPLLADVEIGPSWGEIEKA